MKINIQMGTSIIKNTFLLLFLIGLQNLLYYQSPPLHYIVMSVPHQLAEQFLQLQNEQDIQAIIKDQQQW
jgi:hypothetical protein